MANKFINKFREELYKVSSIDDLQSDSDQSAVLEFLQEVHNLRNESDDKIIELFRRALYSNKILAIKSLFYVRDKKYGEGERRIFNILIKYLALSNPDLLKKTLHLIPKYGRWDDFYSLFDTPLESNVICIFKRQITLDLNCKSPTTLGKWLKSENTSSKASKLLGKKTRELLGYTPKEYRKILSTLRKKIGIIEHNLSSKNYSNINYSKLSLSTIIRYRKALIKNDKIEFQKHLKSLKQREKKRSIKLDKNILTETPFNVVDNILNDNNRENIDVYSNLWNVVCNNYISDIKDTLITLAISGSGCNKHSISYKLAISNILLYKKFNNNRFKNHYIYFDKNPKFMKIEPLSLYEQIESIKANNLFSEINISTALDMILFTSLKEGLTYKEIPQNILIISNNSLDEDYFTEGLLKEIKEKWKLAGFLLPNIKLWIIDEDDNNKSIFNKNNCIIIKGYSKELFKLSIKGECISEKLLMIRKLEDNRYEDIIL